MNRIFLQTATAAVLSVTCCAAAYGAQQTPQPAAGKTATADDSNYNLAEARMHNIHANDHIRLLHKYAAAHKTVPPAVVKERTDTAKFHVQKARASYAKMRESAKDQPAMTKQLDVIDARLAKLTEMIDKLQKQNAEAKSVMAQTAAITAQMAATHAANDEIDRNFYNMDSSSYYTDGLGHFTD